MIRLSAKAMQWIENLSIIGLVFSLGIGSIIASVLLATKYSLNGMMLCFTLFVPSMTLGIKGLTWVLGKTFTTAVNDDAPNPRVRAEVEAENQR